jgi:predicted nucleotidyltransferase
MAACEQEIKDFLKEIEPTPSQKRGAVRSHNNLRAELDKGEFQDRILYSYLSGSYARGTAIAPLDDVDVVFVVDRTFWDIPIFSSLPEPEELLKSFTRAVKYRYPNSRVRTQRRSMCLMLSHIALDVVPAVEDKSKESCIMIPDRKSDKWILSCPKIHSEIAAEVNNDNRKLLKPLIKLLKYWNSTLPEKVRLKSFAIETIAVRLFSNIYIDSLQEGIFLFFDFVVYTYNGDSFMDWESRYGVSFRWPRKLYDVSGMSNLLGGAEGELIRKFMVYAERALSRMNNSYSVKHGDTAWRRVSEALRV